VTADVNVDDAADATARQVPAGREPSTPGLDLYAIAPTLFVEDGHVDTGAMRAAAEWMVGHGIPDVLLTGSYGEFQSLTDDERVEILSAVRNVRGVRTVMACAAGTSTAGSVGLGLRLADSGADLVMVAAPIAAEVSPDEVQRHFELIAEGLGGALVVYNNPVFGTDLTVHELARIVALRAYRAVKQGTHSLRSLIQSIPAVHEASAGRARLLAASDLTAVVALVAGADGLTSTNSWAFPWAFTAITHAAVTGDWSQARRVAAALEPYFGLARRFGQPRTVKAAMQLRGLGGGGRVRPPYMTLGPGQISELERALEKCDAELELVGVGEREARTEGAP
jgi:dihydrodipicolinate synthase/N-acetylneuraminate lyase